MSEKSDRDNRANQLNPNNSAYYSSRGGSSSYAEDDDDYGYVGSPIKVHYDPPREAMPEEYFGCWGDRSGVTTDRDLPGWGDPKHYFIDHFYADFVHCDGTCEKVRLQTKVTTSLEYPKKSALSLASNAFERQILDQSKTGSGRLAFARMIGPGATVIERDLMPREKWEEDVCKSVLRLKQTSFNPQNYRKQYVTYVAFKVHTPPSRFF
jgi:hypothetical protein